MIFVPFSSSITLSSSLERNDNPFAAANRFDLLPIVSQPPIISNELFSSFVQFSYPSQSITRDDNTIEMVDTTEWLIQCQADNPIGSEDELSYAWRRNGVTIRTGKGYENSILYISGSECNESLSGTYDVVVTNSHGYTLSAAVNIQIYSTSSIRELSSNLIENPNGAEGLNSWYSDSDQIRAMRFRDLEYSYTKNIFTSRSCAVDDVFYTYNDGHIRSRRSQGHDIIYNNAIYNGYSNYRFVHFFPSPETIVLPNNKILSDTFRDSEMFYFTRSSIQYSKNNSNDEVSFYQDINVSSIKSFIQGLVYGVEHVSLGGYAYLGGSINSYDSINIFGSVDDHTTLSISFYDQNQVKINTSYEISDPRIDVINSPSICEIRDHNNNELSFNGCSIIKGARISLPFIPFNTDTIRVKVSFRHSGNQSSILNPEDYQWESPDVHKNSQALGVVSRLRSEYSVRQITRALAYGNPRNLITGIQLFCFTNVMDPSLFTTIPTQNTQFINNITNE